MYTFERYRKYLTYSPGSPSDLSLDEIVHVYVCGLKILYLSGLCLNRQCRQN